MRRYIAVFGCIAIILLAQAALVVAGSIPVFTPYAGNPLLSTHTVAPRRVFKEGNEYRMFFQELRSDGTYPADFDLDLMTSTDGITWGTVYRNVVSGSKTGHTFNYSASELKEGDTYSLWHGATSDWNIAGMRLYYSSSQDGISYDFQGEVLAPEPYPGYDSRGIYSPFVLFANGTYYLYYQAMTGHETGPPPSDPDYAIACATSPDGLTWTKHGVVLSEGPEGSFDSWVVGWPVVIYDEQQFEMFYYAGDGSRESTGYATSPDGLNWEKQGEVDSLNGRIVGALKEDGVYRVWYVSRPEKYLYELNYAVGKNTASQYLYVCDRLAAVVHKLTLEGTYVKAFGEGVLTAPVACRFDSQGALIVGDWTDFKVFRGDNYLTSFGETEFAEGGARSVAIDDQGNIYAAKYASGVIEVYSSNYEHIDTLDFRGILGTTSGKYEGPIGISYDPNTQHIIFTTFWASSGDRKLFEINLDGTIVKEFGQSWYSNYGCAMAPDGTFFVKDVTSGIKGIRVFDSSRSQVKLWLQNQIGEEFGIAFDREGKIYVTVDTKNVKVYESFDTETPVFSITSPNFVEIRGLAIGEGPSEGETNSPPKEPSNPYPADKEEGVSIQTSLSWSGGDPDSLDNVTYDLYFGTDDPPPLEASDLNNTNFDPGLLDYSTTYYWRIVSRDSHGAETEGPVWSFTTAPEPVGTIEVQANVADASFTITGPQTFQGSGTSWSTGDATPGEYSISFAPLACWQAPASQTKTLTEGGTITFSGTYVDSSSPGTPSDLQATAAPQEWSNDDTVSVTWTAATDCGSGLAGYSYVWDTSPDTDPDAVPEGSALQASSPSLAEGSSHYFHLRAVDKAGNAGQTVHLGPFYIDMTPPGGPADLHSSTHEVGVCSSERRVQVAWDAPQDPSGIGGYSVVWDASPGTTAPQTVNATETSVASPELTDGSNHYVHIRAVDGAGNWSNDTLHLGPFCIETAVLVPEGLEAASEKGGSITLKWTESLSEDIEGYNVYRSDSENGTFIRINSSPFNKPVFEAGWKQVYRDEGLINGIEYWYRVTAISTTGAESSMSTAVGTKPTPLPGGDFRIEALEPSQVVNAGESVTFHITLVAEDNFSEKVTLWATSLDLPSNVSKEFSRDQVEPTASTKLVVSVPYQTEVGDYSLKLNAISANRSHEAVLHLRVVKLGLGESLITAYPLKDSVGLGETVEIRGQLLPQQPPGTGAFLWIKEPGAETWLQYPIMINEAGSFQFSFQPNKMGRHEVKAGWAGTDYFSPCESDISAFEVGKGKSVIRCSTSTEDISPGATVSIQVEIDPPLVGVPFSLEVQKPDADTPELVTGLVTSTGGKKTLNYTLDPNLPGVWKFKASWAGNSEYIGAISLPLVLYPGVEVGEALIVAGGGMLNNTLWPTIEYLANKFYRVLKNRRFKHDQIFYMSDATDSYDIDGDGSYEYIVDDHSPTVDEIKKYIEGLHPPNQQALVNANRPLIIYMVDHGGIGQFKVNQGEILEAADLDAWLDSLQEDTGCKVVVIVEACHSGTFIQKLAPAGNQERILISSSSTEVSHYDQDGRLSFSQYLMDLISQGDNLRNSFYKTSERLRSYTLFARQIPQLQDGAEGMKAADFYVGGTFLTGDLLPEILEATPNQVINAGIFSVFAKVVDVEGIARVWATIMPPGFIVPESTNEFETPVIDLEKVDLLDPEGDGRFEGSYDFKYNGTYVVTFFAQDTGDNLVSQEVRLTVENGMPIGTPGDLDSDTEITLSDAILALKILCGVDTGGASIQAGADVNGDNVIGLAEAAYVLQYVAEMRQ